MNPAQTLCLRDPRPTCIYQVESDKLTCEPDAYISDSSATCKMLSLGFLEVGSILVLGMVAGG